MSVIPVTDIGKGLISNKSKGSIKLNPQCVLSSKLDFDGTPKDLNGNLFN
jgi:hypothetical protein